MATRKTFRVIKVVNSKSIVIDAGIDADLREGQVVKIVRLGDDVIHPETKENLGKLELIVATGIVHHRQDQFTVVGGPKMVERPFLGGLDIEHLMGAARPDPPFSSVKVGDLAVVYD